ncbi:pyridoxamine 5'-phosphate oxidase family protein [Desertimonas flava]|jgi:PPOX class probable F420-dependent enzyme|uniref:pyridoxamine 5'-phosphate oxidase family protein n=1 Tax=Desertimonas flava TaxID=2064846 RepID=UPI000E347698|nr:pyridoxamine 5'-phosphate oxidase family protein [Desertimonas flava]
MGELNMSREERETFLADLHVGVIAVERADGPPLAAPVWYRYSPGGVVEILTERTSIKGRLLDAAGRASICAQRESLPYAYVTVEGPVEIAEATLEDRTDMAVRYLGDAGGRQYVEQSPVVDDVVVRITPERWFSVDYGKLEQ